VNTVEIGNNVVGLGNQPGIGSTTSLLIGSAAALTLTNTTGNLTIQPNVGTLNLWGGLGTSIQSGSGNISLNAAANDVVFNSTTGNVDFTGVGGNVDFTGVTVLGLPAGGDLWSDPVDSSLVPTVTNNFNIGSSPNLGFQNAYFNSILSVGDSSSSLTINAIIASGTPSNLPVNAGSVFVLPSGSGTKSINLISLNNAGSTDSIFAYTGDSSGNGNTGGIHLVTGDKTGANGSSGNLVFTTGVGNQGSGNMSFTIGTATARGEFKFLKQGIAAPSPNDVWTCTNADGSGYWATPAGGGDAWSDPVNSNIIPDLESNNRDLGSAANSFNAAYVKGLWNSNKS
jgi:hypothetical protein